MKHAACRPFQNARRQFLPACRALPPAVRRSSGACRAIHTAGTTIPTARASILCSDTDNRSRPTGSPGCADTSKSGKPRRLPIPEELLPLLAAQLPRGEDGYLFAKGMRKQLSLGTPAVRVLRQAMVAAEIVDAWEHVCRRKGCGYKDRRGNDVVTKCPKDRGGKSCGFAHWPTSCISGCRPRRQLTRHSPSRPGSRSGRRKGRRLLASPRGFEPRLQP